MSSGNQILYYRGNREEIAIGMGSYTHGLGNLRVLAVMCFVLKNKPTPKGRRIG